MAERSPAVTYSLRVGPLHLHVGVSENHVKLDGPKDGSSLKASMTVVADLITLAFQKGASLDEVIDTLQDVQDSATGGLIQESIKDLNKCRASSVWDAIAQLLLVEFS